MSLDTEPRPVRFSRLPRRGVLLGLSLGQMWALGIAIGILITALYAGGLLPLVTAPVWLGATVTAWLPIAGQPAVDWLPIAGNWALRRTMNQTSYRRRIGSPRPAGQLELPGTGTQLHVHPDPDTGIAMLHDPVNRTLAAILNVGHPAFQLTDPVDQQRRVEGFSRVLASACRSGRLARLQVLERALPDSGSGLADWWTEHGRSENTFTSRTYRDLIARAAPTGERHHTTITIALDLANASRPTRAAGGGLTGARTILRQEMDALAAALRSAGLAPNGWYTPEDLAGAVRTGYSTDVAPRALQVARTTSAAGPVAVDERWDSLRSDTAHHAVLWIAEWPRTLVNPGFLAPLILTSGLRRTTSITYTPVALSEGTRSIRRRKTEYLSDDAHRRRIGRIDDAGMNAEYDDVLQQEADLTAGHGLLHYTGLITISAPNGEQLETGVAAIEQAAIQASCEVRRLVGQQAHGFEAAALPLARPL